MSTPRTSKDGIFRDSQYWTEADWADLDVAYIAARKRNAGTVKHSDPTPKTCRDSEDLRRYVCECGWRGYISQLVFAAHPFRPDERITGCPECRDCPGTLRLTCDTPGCWCVASGGDYSGDSLRLFCYQHAKQLTPPTAASSPADDPPAK
jgi:hypothetical protein